MPTVALAPCPKFQFFDSNGDPASGYKLFTYVTGTATKKATYTDATGNSANTNPIVLDSRGECSCWFLTDANYKLRLCIPGETDPPSTSVWDVDNFGFAAPTFQTLAVTGNETVGGNLTVTGTVTAGSGVNVGQWISIAQNDQTATITTGTAKFTHRAWPACTVNYARAWVVTASSSGKPTFDINDDGVSIFDTTKLEIDANETSSVTAAASPTILNPTIANDSVITIDIDVAGTGAKGWGVMMNVTWT